MGFIKRHNQAIGRQEKNSSIIALLSPSKPQSYFGPVMWVLEGALGTPLPTQVEALVFLCNKKQGT